MEKVTDPELIKKLNEKKERNRVTESKTGSTVVTDLDLIERLDKIREQNIKEEPVTAIDIETKEEELLKCPRCKEGSILKGKTAFGCERFKSGCKTIIPFLSSIF